MSLESARRSHWLRKWSYFVKKHRNPTQTRQRYRVREFQIIQSINHFYESQLLFRIGQSATSLYKQNHILFLSLINIYIPTQVPLPDYTFINIKNLKKNTGWKTTLTKFNGDKKFSRMVEGWPPLSSYNYSVCQIILNNNFDENEEACKDFSVWPFWTFNKIQNKFNFNYKKLIIIRLHK